MRTSALFPLILILVGCGGASPRNPSFSDVPMRLVASDAGTVALSGAATVPVDSNATPGALDLSSARRFSVDSYPSEGTVGFRLTDAQGHLLTFHVGSGDGPLKAGTTLEFGAGASLEYEENGPGTAFRTWTAEGGSVVVDRVSGDDVTLHVAGARMVAGTDPRGGDFPTVYDSAKGEFTFDLQTTLPLTRGSVSFADGGKTSFDGRTITPANGSFYAYSSAREIDLNVSETDRDSSRGRSLLLQLYPRGDSVGVGDTFVLDGRQSVGSAVDYGSDGSHIWSTTSGTATIRAIRGRVVTVDLVGATFVPRERASGTIVASGTFTVIVP